MRIHLVVDTAGQSGCRVDAKEVPPGEVLKHIARAIRIMTVFEKTLIEGLGQIIDQKDSDKVRDLVASAMRHLPPHEEEMHQIISLKERDRGMDLRL